MLTPDQSVDPATPDTFVPDPQVAREFGVTAMTLFRWSHDPKMAALGWPPAVPIGQRNYRSRRALEQFKANLLKQAVQRQDERRSAMPASPARNPKRKRA